MSTVGYIRAQDMLKQMLKREPDATKYLRSFMGLIDQNIGIMHHVALAKDFFPDEPKLINYRTELTPTSAFSDGGYPVRKVEGGRGLTHDHAALSAIFESLERYSVSIYRNEELVVASYEEMQRNGQRALDPCLIASCEKIITFEQQVVFRKAPIAWTPMWSWKNEEEILVPAQTIYLPYRFQRNELMLRDPITIGTAAGLSFGGALQRALLEVLERDATTIVHYRKIPRPQVDPSHFQDAPLLKLLREIKQYQLEVKLYDFSLDLPVPVVVCVLQDHSGIGPCMTIGSKASFDLQKAVQGAILEAACYRVGARHLMAEAREEALPILNDFSTLRTASQRSSLWLQPEMQEHLTYLDTHPSFTDRFLDWDGVTEKKLSTLIEAVIKKGDDILVKEVTTSDIASTGARVIKVLVPSLQPMHLNEGHMTWSKRILHYAREGQPPVRINELNPIPHPFG